MVLLVSTIANINVIIGLAIFILTLQSVASHLLLLLYLILRLVIPLLIRTKSK
jgi:hypothetical protein